MHDVLLQSERVTLLDLLDRLLETGVVVDGEIDLSVADINLIHLGLKLVLASSASLEQVGRGDPSCMAKLTDVSPVGGPHEGPFALCPSPPTLVEAESPTNRYLPSQCAVPDPLSLTSASGCDRPGEGHPTDTSQFASAPGMLAGADGETWPRVEPGRLPQRGQRSQRLNFEAAKVEHGLAKLVLTLVELIRRLMERQAIRRMECGALTGVQTESLGEAFRRLEGKMVELKRVFNIGDEELNLDLGPLGALM